MIPSRREWKAWKSLQKLGYIAQIAATASLFPTVYFSWKTAEEATASREIQLKMFAAENPPILEISTSKYHQEVFIKNTGHSLANDVIFEKLTHIGIGKLNQQIVMANTEDDRIYRAKNPHLFPAINLQKSQSMQVDMLFLGRPAFEECAKQKNEDIVYRKIVIQRTLNSQQWSELAEKPPESRLCRMMIELSYSDIAGNKYSTTEVLISEYSLTAKHLDE